MRSEAMNGRVPLAVNIIPGCIDYGVGSVVLKRTARQNERTLYLLWIERLERGVQKETANHGH